MAIARQMPNPLSLELSAADNPVKTGQNVYQIIIIPFDQALKVQIQ